MQNNQQPPIQIQTLRALDIISAAKNGDKSVQSSLPLAQKIEALMNMLGQQERSKKELEEQLKANEKSLIGIEAQVQMLCELVTMNVYTEQKEAEQKKLQTEKNAAQEIQSKEEKKEEAPIAKPIEELKEEAAPV